ncbi:MAG: alpha/beta fold hydrolase [Acidobacteriia bacterium]|nr:alpha/beta fold hydrolase [Terriglobia bacterium]
MPRDDILREPPAPADQRIRYGPEPEQFADLYFACDKSRAPLAINLHGGYWRAAYDLIHASPFCAALAARGINTANIEYRRVGSVWAESRPKGLPSPSWPRTFQDVRSAYRDLMQRAAELGIAAAPAVILGHSAGGQLALCLAAHEKTVRHCISLAGVLDLRRAWQLHLSNDAVVEFLGGTPEQAPEYYREASPLELNIQNARQAIVHGLADEVVPVAISRDYAAVKKNRGEQVEFVPLPKANHFDVIDPGSKAFATVADTVLRLVSGSRA